MTSRYTTSTSVLATPPRSCSSTDGPIYVIAPDMRGFGRSSIPQTVEGYGTKKVTGDLAGLLDFLNISRAVFVGHDWGAVITWRMCMFHPERVIAVCSVCTPYMAPSDVYVDTNTLVRAVPQFSYMSLLSQPVKAAKLLDVAPRRLFTATFRLYTDIDASLSFTELLRGVPESQNPIFTNPSKLLNLAELDYYVAEYERSGFAGGCNYYAARFINFNDERELPPSISHRALLISPAEDRVLKPEMAAGMRKLVPNLRQQIVANAGHWVLWEQKDEITRILQ
ncbi:epoxide hydrolase, putative [Phytophthora infestans T30-4]|uniref:Epoxide hydrolase, putative n=1 Tax=Phytophthora infestans (strain T30-4) TaxID=403677 RepID=D0NHJ3_PHYIT|nr:epoxide hydrolase, putative [Phytophthora infestans T30-4]EEY58918.1 epoxide hydrolase, putative [Phytophthora infestans T30-4]|eukprot:XP_002901391.1 epoxide hydrolase, putative [Phytophthora infestans T30-4]